MGGNENAPPADAESGGGTEAEEAAWEMATAETLRARGELAEAATWYRRAANHLMEAGDDERAVAVAKLAAELAALDDAGRPANRASVRAESTRAEVPQEQARRSDAIKTAPARAAATNRPEPPPWQVEVDSARKPAPSSAAMVITATEGSVRREPLPWEKGTSVVPPAPPAAAGAPAKPKVPAPPPPVAKGPAAAAAGAPAKPAAPPAPRVPAPPARTSGEVLKHAATPATDEERVSEPEAPAAAKPEAKKVPPPPAKPAPASPPRPASVAAPSVPRPSVSSLPRPKPAAPAVSPLAALVDEAVSNLEELPPAPLNTASQPNDARPSRVYSASRMAEAERVAARLPALPLFAELPTGRLRDVARQVGVVLCTSDEALCESGGPEGPMFLIIEGVASVRVPGQDEPVATVGAGDFVGELSALYGGPRTANVAASGALEALAFAPSLVRALAREFDWFREAVEEAACERARESMPSTMPLLRKLDPAARKALFAKFELRVVEEGTLLLTEGEPADGLYAVVAGEVELYGGEFGARRTHHARAGDALGVSSLVSGEPSGVSARAARTVLVAKLPREAFLEAVASHSPWSDLLGDVAVPGRGVLC